MSLQQCSPALGQHAQRAPGRSTVRSNWSCCCRSQVPSGKLGSSLIRNAGSESFPCLNSPVLSGSQHLQSGVTRQAAGQSVRGRACRRLVVSAAVRPVRYRGQVCIALELDIPASRTSVLWECHSHRSMGTPQFFLLNRPLGCHNSGQRSSGSVQRNSQCTASRM